MENILVKKKKGLTESFNCEKIHNAIRKSADRVLLSLTDEDCKKVSNLVLDKIDTPEITVKLLHKLVEVSLDEAGFPKIAESYRQYRNYKIDALKILEAVDRKTLELQYKADKSNANTDSALVSTKRSIIYGEQQKERYKRIFLKPDELEAIEDGYLYIHDLGSRLDTYNCFKRDTRFLTDNGINSFEDFKNEDSVLVPTPFGNWKNAVVHSYGKQKLQEVKFVIWEDEYSDISRSIKKELKVTCTPNHRWILDDETSTESLKPGDVLIMDKMSGNVWTVDEITPLDIEEEVWCLEVEDDHAFILEGGIPTGNCCLLNVKKIMKDGFTLSTIDYTEPRSISSAISVLSDIISTTAGNQYGGLTVPQIDEILSPYCKKSYDFYIEQYKEIIKESGGELNEEKANKYAEEKVRKNIEQGYQGIEHTFNSVSSSRGDFPFITFTFGHGKDKWSKIISEEILKVRMCGQGKPGQKVPVVFPKLVFLYDSDLHGEGKELENLFFKAIECTKIAQYPDYLSLDAGYIGDVYHEWGKIISPMGS